MEKDDGPWVDHELEASRLPDRRLARRMSMILDCLAASPGAPVPAACQDWAATKAAYRFFDNPRVTESGVLAGHFAATKARFTASDGPILLLQDTTEFIYKRDSPGKIGLISTVNGGVYKAGQPNAITLCGVLMHSSLAVTTSGVPLGLAAVKFWTRDKFKGTNALKRHVNPTRVPIETKESFRWLENLRQSITLLQEPERCVHIGDRESDIYELYCLAGELKTQFLVRVQTDRLAEPLEDKSNNDTQGIKAHRVFTQMAATPWMGTHDVVLGAKDGEIARLNIKFATIKTLPPIGKQKHYRPQTLTYIHALENIKPSDRDAIDWKLVTNLPVLDLAQAIEKLNWYSLRWKIEIFHKVMKSGCRAEDTKLRTAERLVKLLALLTVVSWRIFWMTMSARAHPDARPETILTPTEIATLDQISASRPKPRIIPKTVHAYVRQIAMLGGYLARTSDLPPGNMVIWRGLTRLHDIALGISIGARRRCG